MSGDAVVVAVEWDEPSRFVEKATDVVDLVPKAMYYSQVHVHQNVLDDRLDNLVHNGWVLEVEPQLVVYDILCYLCSMFHQKLVLEFNEN